MQNSGTLIDFRFGRDESDIQLITYSLNVLYFDSASPLHRSIVAEISFEDFPDARLMDDGYVHTIGCVSPTLFEFFRVHPDTRMSNGVLKLDIAAARFLLFVENCFISYISALRTLRLRLPR